MRKRPARIGRSDAVQSVIASPAAVVRDVATHAACRSPR